MPRSIALRLGVVYPGTDNTEFTDLEQWLRIRGCPLQGYVLARSRSDGLHEESSLANTGSLDILRAALTPIAGRVEAVAWACTSGSFIGGARPCS